jgi:site-specific recombinase XerD
MSKPKLLEQVRAVARLKHLSFKTEKAYVHYIRDFILFHQKRHPNEMDAEHVGAYLTYLAAQRNVAASTQNIALCALLFLYRDVLKFSLPNLTGVERARWPARLPGVFSRAEVQAIRTHKYAASTHESDGGVFVFQRARCAATSSGTRCLS